MSAISGLPTIYHILAQSVSSDQRSSAFGYLNAFGSIGQTIAAVVCTVVAKTNATVNKTYDCVSKRVSVKADDFLPEIKNVVQVQEGFPIFDGSLIIISLFFN